MYDGGCARIRVRCGEESFEILCVFVFRQSSTGETPGARVKHTGHRGIPGPPSSGQPIKLHAQSPQYCYYYRYYYSGPWSRRCTAVYVPVDVKTDAGWRSDEIGLIKDDPLMRLLRRRFEFISDCRGERLPETARTKLPNDENGLTLFSLINRIFRY